MKADINNPYIKTAISRVFPSIVRLYCQIGDEYFVFKRRTNGTIFSCIPDADNGRFLCYILTSADLFKIPRREPDEKEGVSPVFKIFVRLPTKIYKGEVIACDMENNIAVVKINSGTPLPTASLTPFNDWISVSPFGVPECRAPSSQSPYPTNVFPGDEVTLVSRPFEKLRRARACSRAHSGAPVINIEGDVIGVAFRAGDHAVFLPVNVFFKWWKQVVTYGEIRRPWMGIQITNLYTADVGDLEDIVHDCDVSDGVIVEKVISKSPASSAKMRSMDVICQCDGIPVRSFLEFTELLWDKSGEVIEAKGVRHGCHFVWKVEIESIKTGILPENLVTLKKLTTKERKPEDEKNPKKDEEEVTGLKAKKRTIEKFEERKTSRWKLSKCSECSKT